MYNSYYNPYVGRMPYNYTNHMGYSNMYNIPKKSLFGGLFSKFSLNGFLNGTSKTLNVINQAIPIYNQVKPMISNAKTMFRVMNAVRSSDSTSTSNNTSTNTNTIQNKNVVESNNSPTFFM